MRFEKMLGYGYVVVADDFLNAVIVWNGKGTFDVYTEDSYRNYRLVVSFTRSVQSAQEAKKEALKWIAREYDSLEQQAA